METPLVLAVIAAIVVLAAVAVAIAVIPRVRAKRSERKREEAARNREEAQDHLAESQRRSVQAEKERATAEEQLAHVRRERAEVEERTIEVERAANATLDSAVRNQEEAAALRRRAQELAPDVTEPRRDTRAADETRTPAGRDGTAAVGSGDGTEMPSGSGRTTT